MGLIWNEHMKVISILMWLVGLQRLTNSQHHSEPDVLHKMITTVNPLYVIDAQIASCTFSL